MKKKSSVVVFLFLTLVGCRSWYCFPEGNTGGLQQVRVAENTDFRFYNKVLLAPVNVDALSTAISKSGESRRKALQRYVRESGMQVYRIFQRYFRRPDSRLHWVARGAPGSLVIELTINELPLSGDFPHARVKGMDRDSVALSGLVRDLATGVVVLEFRNRTRSADAGNIFEHWADRLSVLLGREIQQKTVVCRK